MKCAWQPLEDLAIETLEPEKDKILLALKRYSKWATAALLTILRERLEQLKVE